MLVAPDVIADLTRAVDAVADALRFSLVEADARDDLSAVERSLLVALAADTVDQLDAWLRDSAPAVTPLANRLPPHLADGEAGLRAARAAAGSAVRSRVRRLLLPARGGVAVGLVGAVLLWTLEVAALRMEGTVVLLTAGIGVLALGLLAATAFAPGFVTDLGSGTGPVLTRAGSVGRHVERVFADRTAEAVRGLTALGAPPPRPTTLLRLRATVRSATARVYAAAVAVGLALFLGMTRVLGLL
nr:hypothetical protein [uncultured Actinotalea sp.]